MAISGHHMCCAALWCSNTGNFSSVKFFGFPNDSSNVRKAQERSQDVLRGFMVGQHEERQQGDFFRFQENERLKILQIYHISSPSWSWTEHASPCTSENEGVGARHRTTSVGFYIGDPCKQTCSSVLHHVFCNHTSRRCECRPEHPVNINNRQCVKASSLGSHCAYHEVCVYYVAHSSCQSNKCRCIDGHEPDTESKKCTPKRAPAVLDGTELTTMVSVIVALLLFMALFCLVLRLFSKARFGPSSGDRMADAGSPPPSAAVLSSVDGSLSGNGTAAGAKEGPGSRRKSRNSIDVTGPRRPGNTVPASAETRNMMF